MIQTPQGRVLVNPAHIIRIHVARNRAQEPVSPWQISLKMTDGWFVWGGYQTEDDALLALERLQAPLAYLMSR